MNNDSLFLRAPEPADVDMLYLLENERDAADTALHPAPLSRLQLHDYIATYDADIYSARQLRLIVVRGDDGQAIGAVDLYDFDARNRRAFVGIGLLPQYRGRGAGHEALQLLCRYAAETLGIHSLAALVVADNEASTALFKGAGFTVTGRLRSWHRRGNSYADVFMMQRLFPDS